MLNPPAGVKLAMEAVCTMIYDVKKVRLLLAFFCKKPTNQSTFA